MRRAAGAFSPGESDADVFFGGGGGGGAGSPPFGSGGDGSDDAAGSDPSHDTFLGAAAAAAAAAKLGAPLPADMAAAAAAGGLRASVLDAWAALQSRPIAAALSRALPFVRARMLRDPRYLFVVGAEVAIDAGCATVAEVRKRGDAFWDEFEFYVSDLLVGCVLDVVLVTLMAPTAVLGRAKPGAGAGASRVSSLLAKVPSAVLEPSVKGAAPYTPLARAACLGVKFGEYSLAGMVCGFIGQGVANGLMAAKRAVSTDTAHAGVTPPPLGMTALTWGLFMGVSSNVRYQIVYGLERGVDATIARSFPAAAYAATLAFRFANNVIGGENFIDMARWTGIQ